MTLELVEERWLRDEEIMPAHECDQRAHLVTFAQSDFEADAGRHRSIAY